MEHNGNGARCPDVPAPGENFPSKKGSGAEGGDLAGPGRAGIDPAPPSNIYKIEIHSSIWIIQNLHFKIYSLNSITSQFVN